MKKMTANNGGSMKKNTPHATNKSSKRKYGWIKDKKDRRDIKFTSVRIPLKVRELPPKVDLRSGCPDLYDQGTLGSCTANAIGAAHQFEQIKQNDKDSFIPSRLFIYYNERVMEDTVDEDAGAMIRDGLKTVAKEGVCPETDWPYIISKFTKKPPTAAYTHALAHQVTSYSSIDCDILQMKTCLADGYPFVFGFLVFENFESAEVAKTGIMSMPIGRQMGGHAVMCVGYDDTKKVFIIRNSWGSNWGDKGYFYMPYEFMTRSDLCSDFWTIRLVEDEDEPNHTTPIIPPTPPVTISWWRKLLAFFGF